MEEESRRFGLRSSKATRVCQQREWLLRKIQSTGDDQQLLALHAELSALVQHVYGEAVVHAQRCWRGVASRRRSAEALRVRAIVALHVAAMQIQRMYVATYSGCWQCDS